MSTPTPTTPEGQRLRDHRKATGLTLDEAWADLRQILGKRFAPSKSKLQRMETDTPEASWDPLIVMGLAHLYKCRISDLSPLMGEDYERVSDLVSSSLRWIAAQCDGQLKLLEHAA